jgi:hypothetical protein
MTHIRDTSQLRQIFYQSAPPASVIDEEAFEVFRGGYNLGVQDASAQAFDEAMAENAAMALDADDHRPAWQDMLIGIVTTAAAIALFAGLGFTLGRLTA